MTDSIRFFVFGSVKNVEILGSDVDIYISVCRKAVPKTVRNTKNTILGGGRTLDEATKILWGIIDEAKAYMEDPKLTSEEKRRWAKTLADTIGVLNKLLASQGERQLEDEDLGTFLCKVPKTFRRMAIRRTHVWRKRNS